MPDLLAQPELVTSQAPAPGVSPSQIAEPYSELAKALQKGGEAAETLAKTAATRAGYQAVTTDEYGNVQIQKSPIIGPASDDYERAVKMAALARGEGAAKDADIKLREQFADNPDRYLAEANAYKETTMKKYADLGVPDVGIAMGRAIDATTTFNYRAMSNQKRELDYRTAEKDINAGIADAHDTLVSLARGGMLKDPNGLPEEAVQAFDKWRTLTNQKVQNPFFAYSQDQADYDNEHLNSELTANGIAHHFVDEMYRGSDNPSSAAATTLEAARSILTDPTLKLKDAERHKIYNYVAGEVRSEDALRRQDAFEARQSMENVLDYLKLGGNPSDVKDMAGNVIDTLRRSGYPGEASHFLARTKIIENGGADYGRQSLDVQDQQRNAFAGGVMPSTAAEARLIQHESRGDPTNVNRFGFAGLYQFGAPLLRDLGLYRPGANEDVTPGAWNASPANAPGKWSGTFSIPGFPQVKTLSDFLQNPAAQKAAYDAHTGNMDQQIKTLGLDKYEGQTVGGVPITRAGLYAMIHLAGPEGARVALQSGGRIQVADAFGSTPLSYAAMAAQAEVATPAASLFQQVATTSATGRDLRAEWKTINDDFQKTHIPPSDKVINDVADRAHASDDFALNAQIGHDVALMKIEGQHAGLTLAQQQTQQTALTAAATRGDVPAGYGVVAKDLGEISKSIREGMDKDPISTAVSYSRGRLAPPDPLDFSDPGKLAAGLQQRVPIARWANQTWQGRPVAALDQADVDQIKGQLANPDPAAKAQIYGALGALPDDLLGPTLQKIAGNDTSKLAEASAGMMLREAPDVAKSIMQGLEIMRAGNNSALKAFEPKAGGGKGFDADLPKSFPVTAFGSEDSLNPTGNYATTAEMIKARYITLAANAGKTDYSKPLLDRAVTDVTGGLVSTISGSKTFPPARGMTQSQFDGVMGGLNNNDLAGVTSLNGQAISAEYLRTKGHLEAVGPGRYLVNFAGPGDKPVYAYRYANTERPQRFELNLAGRAPAPPDYSLPAEIPSYGATVSPAPGRSREIPSEGANLFSPSGYGGIRG